MQRDLWAIRLSQSHCTKSGRKKKKRKTQGRLKGKAQIIYSFWGMRLCSLRTGTNPHMPCLMVTNQCFEGSTVSERSHTGFGAKRLVLETWLYHLIAVWLWSKIHQCYCLSSPNSKIEIQCLSPRVFRIRNNTERALAQCSHKLGAQKVAGNINTIFMM